MRHLALNACFALGAISVLLSMVMIFMNDHQNAALFMLLQGSVLVYFSNLALIAERKKKG